MNFTELLRVKAKGSQSKIVLARSSDPRVQQAANLLVELEIGEIYMVRNRSEEGLNSADSTEVDNDQKAVALTRGNDVSVELNSKIHWVDPWKDSRREEFADSLYEKRKNKGWSRERCEKTISDPLYFTGCLLAMGYMDVGVAGSVSTTGDVLRAAIHTIGLRPGSTTISSSFIMELSTGEKATTNIPSLEAYGEHNPEMVIEVPMNQLPPELDAQVGMQLQLNQPDGQAIPVQITQIEGESVTIDANHPLAGKDLNFDIEVVEIHT